MNKITCKECVRTCCDGQRIIRGNKTKGIDPDKLKIGAWFLVHGVIWKKRKNGLWRCIAFDGKTRLCKIWSYRPDLCRLWSCSYRKKSAKRKTIENWDEINESYRHENYSLFFSVVPSCLMKLPVEEIEGSE